MSYKTLKSLIKYNWHRVSMPNSTTLIKFGIVTIAKVITKAERGRVYSRTRIELMITLLKMSFILNHLANINPYQQIRGVTVNINRERSLIEVESSTKMDIIAKVRPLGTR